MLRGRLGLFGVELTKLSDTRQLSERRVYVLETLRDLMKQVLVAE